jgi:predicted amidohydrolase YtcJ
MIQKRAALAALLAALLASPAMASGLIDNINGIATDAEGRIVRFDGLLLDGQGRIEKRLQHGEKRPKTLDYRFDGKGQTVIPAFVDARAELMKLGIAALSLDLRPATSKEDALARLDAYIKTNAGRRWMLGFGWDDALWPDSSPPTAADLDRVVADMPAWLVDANGERGWANSAALRIAGITGATAQPASGHIEMAGGKPTGLLVGGAMDLVERVVPKPAPKDLDAAFLKAQAAMLSRGITAVADFGTDIFAWQTYRRAGDRGALRLRIAGYTGTVEELPVVAGPAPTPWLYEGRLKLAGVNFAIDGGIATRRAWLSAPYADAAENSGGPLLSDTKLRNQMSRAAMDGFAIVLGAHGDRALSEAANAIGEIAPSYGGRSQWRIDGAEVAGADIFARLAQFKAAISVRGDALNDGGSLANARLGARAASMSGGWADMVNNRLTLSFTGSGPFGPLDPLATLRGAMTRESPQGQPPGGWRPDQRLNFGQALRALTAGGAAAIGAGERLGALEPGQYADFLILDRDVEMTRPEDIGTVRILEVWMAGQKIVLDKDK